MCGLVLLEESRINGFHERRRGEQGLRSTPEHDGSITTGFVLDADQQAAISQQPGTRRVILGGPGTGKSTAAVEAVAQFLEAGGDIRRVIALTSSRTTATALRDRIAERAQRTSSGPLARSIASLAHLIVGEHSMQTHREPPVLLSGGDEDAHWNRFLAEDARSADGIAWPSPIDASVRSLPEFRAELREFVARLTERGATPESFAAAAKSTEHAELWGAVASAWAGFQAAIATGSQRAPTLTLSTIVREATRVNRLSAEPRYDLVVVDDAQEFTAGGMELVLSLTGSEVAEDPRRRSRASVLMFGSSDTTAGVFRGAQPDVARTDPLRYFERAELGQQHRFGPEIAQDYARVVETIGVSGSPGERRWSIDETLESTSRAVTVASGAEQTRLIASTLRQRNLVDGVPWSQLAVIARTSGTLGQLAEALGALDVPVHRAGALQWRHSAAVRPLILLLAIAAGKRSLSATDIHSLLTSPYFDLDSVAWRRLRRAVRAEQTRSGATPACSVDEWLVAAARQEMALTAEQDFERVRMLAGVLQRVARHADAAPGLALWEAWDALGCADAWHAAATGEGRERRAANEHLDAVLALFKQADTFSERFPDRNVSDFLTEWFASTLDDDSLVTGGALDAVTIGTPLSFVSTEFDTVVVAGVEESVWPNLKLRSSLLRAEHFVRGASDRQEVRQDEARLFALAISRARRRLLVIAEESETAGPSSFHELLRPRAAADPGPMSVAELVAVNRRTLTSVSSSEQEKDEAASVLRYLADRGVDAARPSGWWGTLELSTSTPIGASTEKPRISPSKIESFTECQVQWAVGNLAGDAVGNARAIGTIVHAAVELASAFTADEMMQLVDRQWEGLEFETEWEAARSHDNIDRIVSRLEEYFQYIREEGFHVHRDLREAKIEVDLDDAILTGYIDWIERSPDGIRICDLKTGSAITKKAAAEHPQLGAYQLAASRGGIVDGESVEDDSVLGARLVYPKQEGASVKPMIREQAPLGREELDAFAKSVVAAAKAMAGSVFTASPEQHCFSTGGFVPDCRVHVIRQVTE